MTQAFLTLPISKRFAKKQQMQWSKHGTHLLLQARTRTLRSTFQGWYPGMSNDTYEGDKLKAAA